MFSVKFNKDITHSQNMFVRERLIIFITLLVNTHMKCWLGVVGNQSLPLFINSSFCNDWWSGRQLGSPGGYYGNAKMQGVNEATLPMLSSFEASPTFLVHLFHLFHTGSLTSEATILPMNTIIRCHNTMELAGFHKFFYCILWWVCRNVCIRQGT